MKNVFLFLILISNSVAQQTHGFTLGLMNHMISNQLNNQQHLNSELSFTYQSGWWQAGFSYRSNNDHRFQLLPEPIELSSPDITNIVNLDEINFNPDRYLFSNQFLLSTVFYYRDISLGIDAYQFTESNYLETVEINNNALFVRGKNLENKRFLADLYIGFKSVYIDFRTGLKQLNSKQSNTDNLLYQLNLSTYPFVELSYHRDGYRLSGKYNEFAVSFAAEKQLSDPQASFFTSAEFGQQSKFFAWQFGLEYQINSAIALNIAYRRNDNQIPSFRRSQFLKELNSGFLEQITNTSELMLGFAYTYSSALYKNELAIDIKLKNEPIYLAKRRDYQSTEFGTALIQNLGNKSYRFYLELKSDDNFIHYKSDFVEISANQSISIPLFLYMNSGDLKERSQQNQIEISLVHDSGNELLEQSTLTLFDRHYWNGEPADLRYFSESENRLVKRYAAENYRQTNAIDSNYYRQKFAKLREFITTISADKHYITDPVESIVIDEVQYPDEVLMTKIGDCEDLLVFYLAALQAIGQQCALIAIKPDKENTVGHVFLLVDSAIPVSEQENLELTDIGVVKRQNYLGEYTLWLPIEVTILDQGFETAYKSGVRQYYDEVILKAGLQNKTVEIIDMF